MLSKILMAVVAFYSISTTCLGEELEINTGQRLLEHSGEDAQIPVGTTLPAFSFNDVADQAYHVGEDQKLAFVFLSTSCPLAKRYTQRLNRLQKTFAEKGVAVVGIFSNSEDDRAEVIAHAKNMQFEFPVVKDTDGYLAKRLGGKMTPQTVLVDDTGVIRYRGAIDDNRYENRVKETYLTDALDSLCANKEIATTETKCLGCTIHLETAEEVGQVTYTQHVARILQDNCQTCHRPNQVAPFSITNYEEAKTWATEINAYAQTKLMPPWKAAANFGEFQHERRLNDEQLALLDRWVKEGKPEGPKADLPPSPKFSNQWALGTPDAILEMPEEYVIGAEGEDDYRHFIVPTNFDRDMYITACDVIPGNRQTVHHVIAYVDTTGKARELDAADPGPGYTRFGGTGFKATSSLGGWTPGGMPAKTPAGTGRWLPKGADVVLQVHYYRTGKEERDQTKIGLYFSDAPDSKKIDSGIAINLLLKLEPNQKRIEVPATWNIREPVYAISISPHMHLLGTEMKIEATLPDGTVKPLIWIKQWDFNWQGAYHFKEPIFLPAGTNVNVVAYYDNTTENPHQPNDPPKLIRWGPKTTDEMCIAFIAHMKAKDWQPKITEK
ncbi:MAG: redoxin domain-containing protein [Pirellulales bacterium]